MGIEFDIPVANELSRQELVNTLETFQDSSHVMTPVELSALTLTLRQCDLNEEAVAVESLTHSPWHSGTLALESLKENAGTVWEKFVAMMKKAYEKIQAVAKNIRTKLKDTFNAKRPGTKSKGFAEGKKTAEQETTTVRDEGSEDAKHGTTGKTDGVYSIKGYIFSMGDSADFGTLLARLNFYPEFAKQIETIAGFSSGICDNSLRTYDEAFVISDKFMEHVDSSAERMGDFFKSRMKASDNDGEQSLIISEDLALIRPDPNDPFTIPMMVEDAEGRELKLPEDRKAAAKALTEAVAKVKPALENLNKYYEWAFANQHHTWERKVQSDEAKKRMMRISRLFTRRANLVSDISYLIEDTVDVALHLVADINAGNVAHESINEDYYQDAQDDFDLDNDEINDNDAALAIESFKENSAKAWNTLKETVKNIYKKFIAFLQASATKLKQMVGKKAGGSNKHFKDVEGESTEGVRKVEIKSYVLDMGDRANMDTLINRMEMYQILINFALTAASQHGLLTMFTGEMSVDEMIETNGWEKMFNERANNIYQDFNNKFDIKTEGDKSVATISDTVKIEFETKDAMSFPKLILNTTKTVEVEVPLGNEDLLRKLQGLNGNVVKGLERLLSESKKILTERDLDLFNKFESETARSRAISLVTLINKRSSFLYEIYKLIDDTADTSLQFAADMTA